MTQLCLSAGGSIYLTIAIAWAVYLRHPRDKVWELGIIGLLWPVSIPFWLWLRGQ